MKTVIRSDDYQGFFHRKQGLFFLYFTAGMIALGTLWLRGSPSPCYGNVHRQVAEETIDKSHQVSLGVKSLPLEERLFKPEGSSRGSFAYNMGVRAEEENHKGQALLWYLRSARIIPRNTLVRQGLQRMLPERDGLPLPWRLARWNEYVGMNTLAWLGIGWNFLFWLSLAFFPKAAGKKIVSKVARITALPALAFGFLVLWNLGLLAFMPLGVVITQEGNVRTGFSQNSTSLEELSEGDIVRVLGEKEEFLLVATSRGVKGWISSAYLEKVRK